MKFYWKNKAHQTKKLKDIVAAEHPKGILLVASSPMRFIDSDWSYQKVPPPSLNLMGYAVSLCNKYKVSYDLCTEDTIKANFHQNSWDSFYVESWLTKEQLQKKSSQSEHAIKASISDNLNRYSEDFRLETFKRGLQERFDTAISLHEFMPFGWSNSEGSEKYLAGFFHNNYYIAVGSYGIEEALRSQYGKHDDIFERLVTFD